MAATEWPTNAHLIEDVARLRYLRREWRTLDPTYGRGNWWTRWRPEQLVVHDLILDGVDFRDLPHSDDSFDAVAFDPPYVAKGGRETSGIKAMDERYGQITCPATPALLQEMIEDGLRSLCRVLRPRGILIVKTKDYISSGKFWAGTHKTTAAALALGFEQLDRFEHLGDPIPQPPRMRADGEPVRQHHSRRNLTTLLVFKAGGRYLKLAK